MAFTAYYHITQMFSLCNAGVQLLSTLPLVLSCYPLRHHTGRPQLSVSSRIALVRLRHWTELSIEYNNKTTESKEYMSHIHYRSKIVIIIKASFPALKLHAYTQSYQPKRRK